MEKENGRLHIMACIQIIWLAWTNPIWFLQKTIFSFYINYAENSTEEEITCTNPTLYSKHEMQILSNSRSWCNLWEGSSVHHCFNTTLSTFLIIQRKHISKLRVVSLLRPYLRFWNQIYQGTVFTILHLILYSQNNEGYEHKLYYIHINMNVQGKQKGKSSLFN
jgi:hypothetical protein